MKRPALAAALLYLCLHVPPTDADEGWWINSDLEGGSLYATSDHPDIALEKEVLIYRADGTCEAHFLFRNTSPSPVSVDVGFPVVVTVPLFERNSSSGDLAMELMREILGKAFVDAVGPRSWPTPREGAPAPPIRWVTMDQFGGLELSAHRPWVLTIDQDGEPVRVDSVGIQAEVAAGDTTRLLRNADDFGPEVGAWIIDDDTGRWIVARTTTGDTVRLAYDSRGEGFEYRGETSYRIEPGWRYTETVHEVATLRCDFLHRLSFPPSSVSTVVVRYETYARGNYDPTGVELYEWDYVLGTGGTWKGAIQALYLLVPRGRDPDLPDAFRSFEPLDGQDLYLATDYDPAPSDRIQLRYSEANTEFIDMDTEEYVAQVISPPEAPAQSFVTVLDASSRLSGTTWTTGSFRRRVPADTLGGIRRRYQSNTVWCEGVGFGPLSLFDGLPESAWCEGVEGDGVGEWVEFELMGPVSGLRLLNGFRKVAFTVSGGWDDRTRALWAAHPSSPAAQMAAYGANGRPRLLELASTDGQVRHELALDDLHDTGDADALGPRGSLWQSFDGLDLAPGRYRLTIREVYPGSRWHDTCLGEIVFHSSAAQLLVEGDDFVRNALNPVEPEPVHIPLLPLFDVAACRGRTVELADGVPIDFVWIEPGTFTMGAPGQTRRVTLTRGFWLGKHELTQGQWGAVMGTAPWSVRRDVEVGPDYPAACISYEDVQELLQRLNGADTGPTFRVPTEAEWEYACQAGTTTPWSFGDDPARAGDFAWYAVNTCQVGSCFARQVGSRLANPCGLHDMHGNLYESVRWVDGDPAGLDQVDPAGHDDWTVRGGYFGGKVEGLMSSARNAYGAGAHSRAVGARLVMEEMP